MSKINQEKGLKEIYNQVKGLDRKMLLAGLTVLVKDTADFIHTSGLQDEATEEFRLVYLDLMNHDRPYWWVAGPELYQELPEAWKVNNIVRNASECNFNLRPLLNTAINQEWTRGPGWYFFKIYSNNIKDALMEIGRLRYKKRVEEKKEGIPDPNKVFKVEDLKNEFSKAEDPAEPIVSFTAELSKRSRFGPEFFYPLMLYMILLLKDTDFVTIR
jgi:hypothetical protein